MPTKRRCESVCRAKYAVLKFKNNATIFSQHVDDLRKGYVRAEIVEDNKLDVVNGQWEIPTGFVGWWKDKCLELKLLQELQRGLFGCEYDARCGPYSSSVRVVMAECRFWQRITTRTITDALAKSVHADVATIIAAFYMPNSFLTDD
jgi:hypothetical protein